MIFENSFNGYLPLATGQLGTSHDMHKGTASLRAPLKGAARRI
jgi:hypothetical protein